MHPPTRRPGPRPSVPVPRGDLAVDWDVAVTAALADAAAPRLAFQPIVDVRRGVVAGYEALSRFDVAAVSAAPDLWFAAADTRGHGAELEARVVLSALEARDSLPRNCFLTVNVSPHLLCAPEVRRAFASVGDLDRMVVELTEHVATPEPALLVQELDALRSRGATIALDDAGSGYSGLQQLAMIRPELVKLDRSLVDHVDRDEVKLALAELVGTFAGRLDAWLLAEGVERMQELQALSRLGVPLAQGWLFGAAVEGWSDLPPGLGDQLRRMTAAQATPDAVRALAETWPAARGLEGARALLGPVGGHVVVLDPHDRPTHLLAPSGDLCPVTLRVAPTAAVADVAQRAMARPAGHRFVPAVVTDAAGRYAGVVPVERLVHALARAQGGTAQDRG